MKTAKTKTIEESIQDIKLAMAVINNAFHNLEFDLHEASHKQFTMFDMIEFGKYLLSKERKNMFIKPEHNGLSRGESMKMVWYSDIENWKHLKEQNKPNKTVKDIVTGRYKF
jgi:hypothetical protein